jgi:hypothetical protein
MKNGVKRKTSLRSLAVFLAFAAAAAGTTCSREGSGALDVIVVFSSEVRGYLEACG